MEVAAGRCPQLIIEMPPQHGKSQLVSMYGTAWRLGVDPDCRVILSSYEADYAAYWGRKSRDLLEAFGPEVFGVRISQDSSAANHWEIEGHRGMMNTAGVNGPITGKSADWFIVDDPIKKPDEAKSPLMRQKIWEWFKDVALTRLQPGAAITVIMTRWHKDDLAGRLEQEGGWRVIKLPVVAGENDQLGRQPGEELWPEHFGVGYTIRRREERSPYSYASLYQQDPTEEGGNIVKSDWLKEYLTPPVCDYTIQSWDTAFKNSPKNDLSVCGTFGATCNGYYLLDVWVGQPEFPELYRQAVALAVAKRPAAVLIEDKASGQSLIQMLQANTTLPVLPIEPCGDKPARMNEVTPLLASGRFHVPAPQLIMPDGSVIKIAWLAEYLSEMTSFPNAEHDDRADMTSQALKWFMQRAPIGEAIPPEKASYRPALGRRR